ncbi:MAG: hypothetical protein ACOYNY_22885 [Caldilineaceae bacterium]
MFFLISGSAASGKTTLVRGLPTLLTRVVCHDADERVATTGAERCAQLEQWVADALLAQQTGDDFLLTSNSPLGELLACPSAPGLASIAACVLDCADQVRVVRLRARGIDPDWPPSQHLLNWASWHRLHAWDPQWEPHVITGNGPATHRYDRWRSWQQGDPRWQVDLLDTTTLTIDETLHWLAAWVERKRNVPVALTAANRWWETSC